MDLRITYQVHGADERAHATVRERLLDGGAGVEDACLTLGPRAIARRSR